MTPLGGSRTGMLKTIAFLTALMLHTSRTQADGADDGPYLVVATPLDAFKTSRLIDTFASVKDCHAAERAYRAANDKLARKHIFLCLRESEFAK
jgi:hypothetical protein